LTVRHQLVVCAAHSSWPLLTLGGTFGINIIDYFLVNKKKAVIENSFLKKLNLENKYLVKEMWLQP
jgi:hypothetical protein